MVELIPMSVAISGPLKEQWGYLFVNEFGKEADKQKHYRTLSHELGHGRTALPHTFKDDYIAKYTTNNLMDYVDPGSFPPNGGSGWEGATDLVRAQWDMVHNPAIFTPLQSDGDGAAVSSINLLVFNGTTQIRESSFLYITNAPEMPDIRAKVDAAEGKYEMQLMITDSTYKTCDFNNDGVITTDLARADVTYYPSQNTWKQIDAGAIWDVDFGTDFRGGKAYLTCKKGELKKTFVFYIRGENPTQEQVQAYVQTLTNGNEWYVIKIMRHESMTLNRGDDFRQFNEGDWGIDKVGGRPNWGCPYGWGIMQLDNLGTTLGTHTLFNDRWGPSTNELWNWKDNIRKGLQFFTGSKLAQANTNWNSALDNIKIWNSKHLIYKLDSYPMIIIESLEASEINTSVNTISAGNDTNNETITSNPNPVGEQRSLRDAFAIKYYNGGADYFSIFIPEETDQIPPERPHWKIDKTQLGRDYVNEVCGRYGW